MRALGCPVPLINYRAGPFSGGGDRPGRWSVYHAGAAITDDHDDDDAEDEG